MCIRDRFWFYCGGADETEAEKRNREAMVHAPRAYDFDKDAALIYSCLLYTSMCNGCKLWHRGKHSCQKYPQKIPEGIRFEEYHECPDFELIAPGEINYKSVKANIERLKK